ncbi:MAG: hypothetical protein AB7N80_11110 [Bdellovibrionales bacterium]
MNRGMLIFSLILIGTEVGAETMTCAVGVYRAENMINEKQRPEDTNQLVRVPLTDEGGEFETKINGEKVAVTLNKRQFTDLYDLNVVLMTPVVDHQERTSFVAAFDEHLINAGPAKNNGWTIDYQPGAEKYEFLQRSSGTFAVTPKLRKAMIAAGLWGKHPFTTSSMDVQYGSKVAEAVQELLNDKRLSPKDVVGISATFSCTKNK